MTAPNDEGWWVVENGQVARLWPPFEADRDLVSRLASFYKAHRVRAKRVPVYGKPVGENPDGTTRYESRSVVGDLTVKEFLDRHPEW